MNVLPKKRAQQFAQFLTLSRSISLPKMTSGLRDLPQQGKKTVLSSVDFIRSFTQKSPFPHKALNIPSLNGVLKTPSFKGFSKNAFKRILNLRFAWFSASLAMYVWYMLWIAEDILVLHRAITQVPLTNYVGVIISMALIWGGNTIFKTSPVPVMQQVKEPEETHEMKSSTQKRSRQPKFISLTTVNLDPLLSALPKHLPDPQPEPLITHKPRKKRATSTASVVTDATAPVSPTIAFPTKCDHRITTSLEIPDDCLTCTELIACLSIVGKKRSRMGRAGWGPETFGS